MPRRSQVSTGSLDCLSAFIRSSHRRVPIAPRYLALRFVRTLSRTTAPAARTVVFTKPSLGDAIQIQRETRASPPARRSDIDLHQAAWPGSLGVRAVGLAVGSKFGASAPVVPLSTVGRSLRFERPFRRSRMNRSQRCRDRRSALVGWALRSNTALHATGTVAHRR